MAAEAMVPDKPDSPGQAASFAQAAPRQRVILSVVLLYASLAALWILLSDEALTWLIHSPEGLALASTLKGWGFVAVTALGLYVLLWRWTSRTDTAPRILPAAAARRVLGLPFLLIALVLTGIAIAATIVTLNEQRAKQVARLQSIAHFQVSQIADWLKRQQADAQLSQSSPVLSDLYRRWQIDRDAASGTRLQRSWEQSLHHDLGDWLTRTLATWPVPSASGESLLFRRDGDQVLYIKDLRYRAGTALKEHLPVADPRLLAAQALRGAARAGEALHGVDYRGVESLGVAQPIAGTDWFLLAKIDRAEADAPDVRQGIWIALSALLALLVTAAALYLARQREQLRLAATVQEAQTKRLSAKESRRISEARLHLLIEHAPAALAMFDREMRYLAVSRRWQMDYCLADGEVLGRSHYDLFPDIPERWREAHRRGLAGETVHTDEDAFQWHDGTMQWVRWEVRPWYADDTTVGGIVLFTDDITERKRIELALRDSESRYRDLVQNANSAILSFNSDGIITFFNEYAQSFFGYRVEEILGQPVAILVPPSDSGGRALRTLVEVCYGARAPRRYRRSG